MTPFAAVPLVPSTTARHTCGTDTRNWTPVMLPVTTRVAASNESRFTRQGRLVALKKKVAPRGPVQGLKLTLVIEPMPRPGSPVPPVNPPAAATFPLGEQAIAVPVLVSVTVSRPACAGVIIETPPPGRTVQVRGASVAAVIKEAAATAAGTATRLRRSRVLMVAPLSGRRVPIVARGD